MRNYQVAALFGKVIIGLIHVIVDDHVFNHRSERRRYSFKIPDFGIFALTFKIDGDFHASDDFHGLCCRIVAYGVEIYGEHSKFAHNNRLGNCYSLRRIEFIPLIKIVIFGKRRLFGITVPSRRLQGSYIDTGQFISIRFQYFITCAAPCRQDYHFTHCRQIRFSGFT